MNPEIARRYSAPVPRYTSYPTAPHFSPAVGREQYAEWLEALPEHARISLYYHIPFCNELCWYCGCCTKAVQRYEPVASYVGTLTAEIASIASRLNQTYDVEHIHWGGGTPNILSPEDIVRLDAATRSHFRVRSDVEFAVEIDPRTLQIAQVEAFALAGVTRVSIGVQDFDLKVQTAINRAQTFVTTRRTVEWFRERGINSINIDLVYGLPHQTRDTVEETIERVLALQPDRIAIFGYAHLPSRFKHHGLIDEAALPDAVERFAQSNRLAHVLAAAGYVRIGLDHFARKDDPIAQGKVSRNFQGYTSDTADALIGLGTSAIGRLPQGYVQNAVTTADYVRRIEEGGLATVRGKALTNEDRVRAYVIERLMCDLSFAKGDIQRRFGDAALPVVEEAESLVESDSDKLVERTADGFIVTDRGRPFVRSIAACFDSYLGSTQAQYSAGI